MGIYYGTQQVKPSGIASVWVGNNKVYEAGGTKSVVESIVDRSITSIDMTQDNITTIGRGAFSDCSLLQEIYIPDSVTTVAMGAFYNCTSLTRVTIGTGLTSMNNSSFSSTGLVTLTINATVPPTINAASPFPSSLTRINVPSASLSDYQNATYWSAYASKMVGV